MHQPDELVLLMNPGTRLNTKLQRTTHVNALGAMQGYTWYHGIPGSGAHQLTQASNQCGVGATTSCLPTTTILNPVNHRAQLRHNEGLLEVP